MSGIFGRKYDVSPVDKDFVALSFYLAGAAEMASVVLAQKEDPEVKEVGRVLGQLSTRFGRDGLPRTTVLMTPPPD
jgi:hypothetical protein